MGRKKKFSTDELIGFIKQYLIEHQSLELLMPTKVADYCRNVLHISIVYQSFTRDPLVKKWIDDYNTNLHQRVTNEIFYQIYLLMWRMQYTVIAIQKI